MFFYFIFLKEPSLKELNRWWSSPQDEEGGRSFQNSRTDRGGEEFFGGWREEWQVDVGERSVAAVWGLPALVVVMQLSRASGGP